MSAKSIRIYSVNTSGRMGTESLTFQPGDGFITSVTVKTEHLFPEQSCVKTEIQLTPEKVDKLIEELTKMRSKQCEEYPRREKVRR